MLEEFLKQNNMQMEDFIKVIFDYQENNSNIGSKISNKLKEIHKEEEREYLNIKTKLEEYGEDREETRELLDKLIEYKQVMLSKTLILNEKYYRMGFKNGISFLIQCLKEDN